MECAESPLDSDHHSALPVGSIGRIFFFMENRHAQQRKHRRTGDKRQATGQSQCIRFTSEVRAAFLVEEIRACFSSFSSVHIRFHFLRMVRVITQHQLLLPSKGYSPCLSVQLAGSRGVVFFSLSLLARLLFALYRTNCTTDATCSHCSSTHPLHPPSFSPPLPLPLQGMARPA